jgi:hypothetical protein
VGAAGGRPVDRRTYGGYYDWFDWTLTNVDGVQLQYTSGPDERADFRLFHRRDGWHWWFTAYDDYHACSRPSPELDEARDAMWQRFLAVR